MVAERRDGRHMSFSKSALFGLPIYDAPHIPWSLSGGIWLHVSIEKKNRHSPQPVRGSRFVRLGTSDNSRIATPRRPTSTAGTKKLGGSAVLSEPRRRCEVGKWEGPGRMVNRVRPTPVGRTWGEPGSPHPSGANLGRTQHPYSGGWAQETIWGPS